MHVLQKFTNLMKKNTKKIKIIKIKKKNERDCSRGNEGQGTNFPKIVKYKIRFYLVVVLTGYNRILSDYSSLHSLFITAIDSVQHNIRTVQCIDNQICDRRPVDL